MALLDLKGCIVTIDAAGCHRAIAEAIIAQGMRFAQTTDGEHGRIEVRRAWAVAVEEAGLIGTEGWPALRTVLLIERERETGSKTTLERAYYISGSWM